MIKVEAIDAGDELATVITQSDVELTAKIGTPLSQILNTMHYFPGAMVAGNDTDIVTEAAQPTNPDFDPHSRMMETFQRVTAQRIAANCKIARNDINPLIKDIYDRCVELEQNAKDNSRLFAQTVTVEVTPILKSSKLLDLISNYQNGQFRYISLSNGLMQSIKAGIDEAGLVEALDIAGDDWRNLVIQMIEIAKNELGSFESVVTGLLQPSNAGNTIPEYNTVAMFESVFPTLNFLVVNAFKTGRLSPAQSKPLTMNEQTALGRLTAFYGNNVNRQIEMIAQFSKTKRFIITNMTPGAIDENALYIYGKNFQSWLNASETNTIDLVLGAYAESRSSLSQISVGLIENPSLYQGMYNQVAKREAVIARNASGREFMECIETNLLRYIHIDSNLDDPKPAITTVINYIKENPINADTNLLSYIQTIVCDAIVPDSMVKEFLSLMDGYLDADSNMTHSEAANYACVTLCARWLAAQVNATYCGNSPRITYSQL